MSYEFYRKETQTITHASSIFNLDKFSACNNRQ